MNTAWKAALGVTVSALLLAWVLRGVALGEVWAGISGANGWLLLAAIAVGTSGFLVRALRWRYLLAPLRSRTGAGNRFAAVAVGFSVNNLLPARVGEFARAWVIARLERIPTTGALGSLVVERFLDLVAVFALMSIALLHPSFPTAATVAGRPVGTFAAALVVVMGVVLVGIVLVLVAPRHLVTVVDLVTRLLPARVGLVLVDGTRSFVTGLTSLRDPRLLVVATAWSFAFWSWNAFSFLLAMRAVGIELGFIPILFIQAIIVLGVAIPSAPGFFGTFHAAAVVGMVEVYGVSQGATLAFAFGYHLGMFFPITLIGLWYAGRIGVSLRDLGGAEAALARDVPANPVAASPAWRRR
jgi:glycosyltransferase 2 family protein